VAAGSIVVGIALSVTSIPVNVPIDGIILLLVVCVALLLAAPETVQRRAGAVASLRPTMRVPRGEGLRWTGACMSFIGCWSLGGYYQALAPAAASHTLGASGPVQGGLVTASLVATTVVGGLVTARFGAMWALRVGPVALVTGLTLVMLSLQIMSYPLFIGGSGVAGAGFGATVSASVSVMAILVDQGRRAGVIASLYLVGFLGAGVITWLSGRLVGDLGYTRVTYWMCLWVIGTSFVGTAILRRRMVIGLVE
jgi:hypothetical protein